MTKRLEDAIKRLTPEQIEQLTAMAEQLSRSDKQTPAQPSRKFKLDWGGTIDSEHTSGLEAQAAAMREWRESIERKLAR